MNEKNTANIYKFDTEKILGRKIKRNELKTSTNFGNMKHPPSISQSTLIQIDKVIKKRKKKLETI